MDRSLLSQLTVVRRDLAVYRHVHPGNDSLTRQPHRNRWATANGTLYTATSLAGAWAECCRHLWHDIELAKPPFASSPITLSELERFGQALLGTPMRDIYEIHLSVHRLADLTNATNQQKLVAAGFSLSDFTTNIKGQYGLCPTLAAIGEALGWEGLIAPSAALLGESTAAIFEPGMRRVAKQVRLGTESPSVAMAVATTYRIGEKPGWVA